MWLLFDVEIFLPQEQGGDAEEEAGAEISALVNYVQPVHFHSFEASESEWPCVRL